MRRLITLFALFSLFAAFGQEDREAFVPFRGRELPRGRITPAPRAALADEGRNTYVRTVAWQRTEEPGGTRFTAECSVPFAWANRQVLLRIASAPAGYDLHVNGRSAGGVRSGALTAEFNVTKYLREGANRLELFVEKNPAARVLEDFDHPVSVGLSQLVSQPTIRIRDVLVSTRPADGGGLAEIGIVVKCDALNEKQARIHYDLRDTANRVVAGGFGDLTLSMRGEDTLRFTASIPASDLWEPDSPMLYRLQLRTQTAGRYTEYLSLPIGFRFVEMRGGELFVNGRAVDVRLCEVARPLTGADAERLKASGSNLLCPAPGVCGEELYELCDRLGLYVVAQAPLCTRAAGLSRAKDGNPTNCPDWTEACIDRTEASYHAAKRHPSVVAFSLARSSANGIGLYESYLNLKRLEPQRPILYFDAEGEWNSDKFLIISHKQAE